MGVVYFIRVYDLSFAGHGLFKVVIGLAGLILAFILSVVASGVDVVWEPYTVLFSSDSSGYAASLLKLPLGKAYRNVTVLFENIGYSSVRVSLDGYEFTLAHSASRVISLDNLLSRLEVDFIGGSGDLRVTVFVVSREGIKPYLSLLSIAILLVSMVIAGYGIVEYVLGRRL